MGFKIFQFSFSLCITFWGAKFYGQTFLGVNFLGIQTWGQNIKLLTNLGQKFFASTFLGGWIGVNIFEVRNMCDKNL